MRLFHDIIKLCKTNILRELRKIFNIFSDRRDVRINRTRGDAKNAIQNIFLVSCLVGRLSGLKIPNLFLETLATERGHSRETFYNVKKELHDKGLITKSDTHSQYIELSSEGLRLASNILIGREEDNPRWEDIRESARQHLWVFWIPMTRLRDDERDNLLRSLLILYSYSQGDTPEEFYRNLLLNIRLDLSQHDSVDALHQELVDRLVKLYSKLARIYEEESNKRREESQKGRKRPKEEREELPASLQLIINSINVLHRYREDVCMMAFVARVLRFRKYLTNVVCLVIKSIMYMPRYIYLIYITFLAVLQMLSSFYPIIYQMFSTILLWFAGGILTHIVLGLVLLYVIVKIDRRTI